MFKNENCEKNYGSINKITVENAGIGVLQY